MSEQRSSMTARGDQPLIGILVREQGQDLVRYIADESELENYSSSNSVAKALALAGVWKDLDPDEVLDSLDRIRHGDGAQPHRCHDGF
jgi:hypothetical protein